MTLTHTYTRTFSKHGHPWTPENTLIHPRGERRCRTCKRRDDREAYRRKQAALSGASTQEDEK